MLALSFIHTLSQAALSKLFNERLKKTIFLASLAGVIAKQPADEVTTVGRISEIFDIGMRPYSLRGPYRIHTVIWGDNTRTIRASCQDPQSASDASLKLIADKILQVTPSWLRYASQPVMHADVVRLISFKAR